VVVVGATGLELVHHGVLPGKQFLNQIDGACSCPTALSFRDGRTKRKRTVSIPRHVTEALATPSLPASTSPGDSLAIVVMLHGYGNNHATALFGMSPAQALALRVDDTLLSPMAMVTVDGGNGTGSASARRPHGDGGS